MESVFKRKSKDDLRREVGEVYTNYDYPWVVGYSGGKDSTATLQLIWEAVEALPEDQRKNHIYVISTDTLVETPAIVGHVLSNLEDMNERAREAKIPLTAHKLSPELEDTFWVNLIGKGYPAPNSMFRWCTDRMKIKPSNRFILDKVAKHGEVILALGMRKGESNTRDQVLENYKFKGHKLSRHSKIAGAWVFTPIEEFTVDDVWTYVLERPVAPWGANNRNLSALYYSAQSGDCPLVVDDTTPSCGNSRFGCWTCTVVSRDKSMEAMIDSGADWLEPLLNFRDWLVETQNPDVKSEQREFKGRDGRIKLSPDGKLRYRTYKLEFSKEMLRRLLDTQKLVFKHDPFYVLISMEELQEIRKIWITERQDWEDSLPKLYEEIMGKPFPKGFSDIPKPGEAELKLLSSICDEYQVPLSLTQKLLDAEWQYFGLFKRINIQDRIESIFEEDWRSFEEIAELSKQLSAAIPAGVVDGD